MIIMMLIPIIYYADCGGCVLMNLKIAIPTSLCLNPLSIFKQLDGL